MNPLKTNKKIGMLILIVMTISRLSYATTYTASASGNWSNSTTWGGTAPSFTNTGDQIVIPAFISVAMDNNVTLNGSSATLAVAGSLTGAAGTYLNITMGTVSGTGNITTGYVTIGDGSSIVFTGTITADYVTNTTTTTLKSYANIVVNKSITLTSGVLSIESGGTIALSSGAGLVMSGGSLVSNSGTLTLTNNYNVTYTSAATAGAELIGSGLNNLTINIPSSSMVTLNSNLVVKGTLTLTSGILNLGTRNLTLAGDVSATGSGTISTSSANDISIITSNSVTGVLNFTGNANTVNNFTVAVGISNHVQLGNSLTIVGTLTLTSGTVNLSGTTNLNINGDISVTGSGRLAPSSSSNISINTAVSPTGTLAFASGNNSLNNLTLNIANGGTFKLKATNSNLNIMGTLTLTKGMMDIGSDTLMIAASGSISNAGSTTYIITGTGGYLAMNLNAGSSSATMFPIGTSTGYSPATATLNSGSTSGMVMINASNGVHTHGLVGGMLSATQPMVNATWDIKSSIPSNLNMNISFMWMATYEMNSFNRAKAYISHYTNNSWDTYASSASTTATGGLYASSRTNISSLSPFAVFDQATNAGLAPDQIALNQDGFGLYPNPAFNNVSITSPTDIKGDTYVEIYNMNGALMAKSTLQGSNQNVDVSQLSNGCYTVKLINDNSIVLKKFIKM